MQNPEKLKLARVVVINDANGQQRNKLYPLQVGFKKYGQSGIEVSDWLPHIGECVDDIAVVRSMYTTDDNHGARRSSTPAGTCSTASSRRSGPGCTTASASLNDNLPQFISMGNREYWNVKDGHYLGPAHDAVPSASTRPTRSTTASPKCRVTADGAEGRLRPGRPAEQAARRSSTPTTRRSTARIKAYELAFRMQKSLPEVLDFAKETEETKKLYGLDRAGDARLRHAAAGGAAAGRARRAVHPGPARRRRGRRRGTPTAG